MSQDHVPASFGYWLRRRRMALDLTQGELARRVHCATVTISKIERDERRPSRQLAALLAGHLEIPTHERERFIAVALGDQAVHRPEVASQPATEQPVAEILPPKLPIPQTPFVGREAEVDQLLQSLNDPRCRLLTLYGAGGFGKTRLAIRLGELLFSRPNDFADGICFVPLDGLEGPDLVVPAIAAALAYTFHSQQEQEEQLFSYLARRHMVLILDNAEEVLEADLVTRLLAHTPGVKIVVTTREALNLQKEWLYRVDGLPVEQSGGERQAGLPDVSDAATLFYQCARRVRGDFDLLREHSNVEHICRMVDGAPLAIELAAAWLKVLSCAQVAEELAHGIDILATSQRDVPFRHRSMRAVLDQSWEFLGDNEQHLLQRLSVFEGGFRLDAARSITGALLTTLAALVEKSMLYLEQSGRYRIHALLQQYGAEKLANNEIESAQCRARHSEHYVNFLAARSKSIGGPYQQDVAREVQEEMDNIGIAWNYAAREGSLRRLGEASPCLFRYLWMRGRYVEGMRLTQQALAGKKSVLSRGEETAHIQLMTYGAQFAGAMGDHDFGLSQVRLALADAEKLGFVAEQAHCYYVIGLLHRYSDNHSDQLAHAMNNLRIAYALYQQLGDDAGIAETATMLVYTLSALQGESEERLRLADESVTLFRKLGDRYSLAAALNHAALSNYLAGEFNGAEKLFTECLTTAQLIDNRLVAAEAVGGLGLIAWTRTAWDQAVALMLERLARTQDLGHQGQVSISRWLLFGTYVNAEKYAEALSLMRDFPELRHTPWSAQAQVGAGAFREAMSYLPQATADNVMTHDIFHGISSYLIAWAMLLMSDCPLRCPSSELEYGTMTALHRCQLSFELLTAVASDGLADAATRMQAGRLLTRLQQTSDETPHGTVGMTESRNTQDLAREVLSIRIE